MALTTLVKTYMNRGLQHVNLRIDTLTAAKQENKRLQTLEASNHFIQPSLPIPLAFESMDIDFVLERLSRYRPRFDDFNEQRCNDVAYTFDNSYFTSPDAEILYTLVRTVQPRTVVEVGSGHSTKLTRQAIIDGQLGTHLVAIDPRPRLDVIDLADTFYRQPVETLGDTEIFRSLQEGDILFIDSSHEIRTGNDTVFLYLHVLPILPPGVLIHIHDIFLPYEYPRAWVVEKQWGFNEQYITQSLLTFGSRFEVLWAGYFLQRTQPCFAQHFPHLHDRVAKSLWLRTTA